MAKTFGYSMHDLCTADLGPYVLDAIPSPLVSVRSLKMIPSAACYIERHSASQVFGQGNALIQRVMKSIPRSNLSLPRTCWQFYCTSGILAFLKAKKQHGWRYLIGACNPLCGAFDAVITKCNLLWEFLMWLVQQHKEEKQIEIKLLAPTFALPGFCHEQSNNGQWYLYRILIGR
jgi:hypothetical protein